MRPVDQELGGTPNASSALVTQVAIEAVEGIQHLPVFTSSDPRGDLTRVWPLGQPTIDPSPIAQVLISRNTYRHTLRGMHFQRGEHAERKVVSIIRGRALDVVVDLRPDSETYLAWAMVELDADIPTALCIPAGLAHGYLTLTPRTELTYVIDRPYEPRAGSGIRWDDAMIGIDWPASPAVVSEQDQAWPDLSSGFSALDS